MATYKDTSAENAATDSEKHPSTTRIYQTHPNMTKQFNYYGNFAKQRRRIDKRLNNPRILKDHIYINTPLEGHNGMPQDQGHSTCQAHARIKHLLSTEVYLHLTEELFSKPKDQKFITRASVNIKGCRVLAEAGFEKFDELDGVHLYRKPK